MSHQERGAKELKDYGLNHSFEKLFSSTNGWYFIQALVCFLEQEMRLRVP